MGAGEVPHGCGGGGQFCGAPGPDPPGPAGGVHPAGATAGGGGQTSAEAGDTREIEPETMMIKADSTLRNFIQQ